MSININRTIYVHVCLNSLSSGPTWEHTLKSRYGVYPTCAVFLKKNVVEVWHKNCFGGGRGHRVSMASPVVFLLWWPSLLWNSQGFQIMPFEKLGPIIRLEGSRCFGGTLDVVLHHSLGLRRSLLLFLSNLSDVRAFVKARLQRLRKLENHRSMWVAMILTQFIIQMIDACFCLWYR